MLLTNSLFIHLIQDPCKADIVGKDLQWPRFVPNNVKEKYTIHQTIKFLSCLMSSLHTSLSWCAEIPMKCIDSTRDCSAFKDCLNLVYKRTISIKQRKSYSFAFHKNHFFLPFFLPWRSCVAEVTVYPSQTELLSPDFATRDDLITMDWLEFWWFEKVKHYSQRRLRTNCTDHIVTCRNKIYMKVFLFFFNIVIYF